MSPSASFLVLTNIFKKLSCQNQSKALLHVEDKIFDLLNLVWQQWDDPVSACHEEDLHSLKIRFWFKPWFKPDFFQIHLLLSAAESIWDTTLFFLLLLAWNAIMILSSLHGVSLCMLLHFFFPCRTVNSICIGLWLMYIFVFCSASDVLPVF